MKNEVVNACYQLITALINGTCQGIVLTLLVVGGLRLLGRTNAATRHAVWFGTLLLVALLIPAHWLRAQHDSALASAQNIDSVSQSASAEVDSGGPLGSEAPARRQRSQVASADLNGLGPLATPGETDTGDFAVDPPREQYSDAEDFAPGRSLPGAMGEAPSTVENPGPSFRQQLQSLGLCLTERLASPVSWKVAPGIPLSLAMSIPLLWLVVGNAKLSLLAAQLVHIRRLKNESAPPSPELTGLFHSLRRELDVRRNVILKVSAEHRSPVVLGFLNPVILLPADAGLGEASHVLRHELAHVRRRDDWVNLVQQVVTAAFFFHPAIYWISKRISLEREIACDDHVLQSTQRPRAYALVLADLAGRMQPAALAPGVSTSHSQLKQRIDMILNPNRNTSPILAKARLGMLATIAAAIAAVAIYSAPRVVLAQSTTPAAPAATTSPPDAVALPEGDAVAPPAPLVDAVSPVPLVAPGPKYKPGTVGIANPPTFAPRGPIAVRRIMPVPPVPQVPAMTPVPPGPAVTPSPRALVIARADDDLNQLRDLLDAASSQSLLVAGADASGPERPGQPPRAGRRAPDSSLEERLERLEKMVESLVAQQKNKPGQPELFLKTPGEHAWTLNRNSELGNDFTYKWELKQPDLEKKKAELEMRRAQLEKSLAELEKQHLYVGPKETENNKALAEQQAKMAADKAKLERELGQVAREVDRASRSAREGGLRASRDGARPQLEALRRQREALGKQMEKLDRQIEKMEREQDRSDEEQENEEQNDASSDKAAQQPSGHLSAAQYPNNPLVVGADDQLSY